MDRAFAAALLGLAVVAMATPVSADAIRPGNQFPSVERTFFLSGEDSVSDPGAFALVLEAPSAEGQHTFVLPGVTVLGVVNQEPSQAWSTEVQWEKDLEATEDSTARLFFVANAQAMAIFEVRLYDVASDGTVSLVDSNQQQFITALSPTPVSFPLHTTGIVVHKGHFLRLEVFAQTVAAAVVLQYGGTTPSALEDFTTRWLDSDADGVPDSDEAALGRNPLNPNDPVEVVDEGADRDGDGLADRTEATLGTDAGKVDTDGDGFGDGLEVHAGTDALDAQSKPYDVNHNGLPDSFETNYFNSTTVNPTDGPCTPGAGCIDPAADPDGDGCTNLCEASNGTDPHDGDSDDDGVSDGDELADRTDPNSAASVVHGPSGPPEPVAAAGFFAFGTSISLIALLRRPQP